MHKHSQNMVYVISFLLILTFSYIITIAGLLLLALLLYKIPLTDSSVNIGIIIIYIFSSFFGAFLCGKRMQNKKFIWGFLLGCSYFLVLLIISFITNQSTVILGTNVFTAFIICSAAGTLGGMLA